MKKWLILIALLAIATTADAQPWRTPGGGGVGWTPASPTSGGVRPVHWYKADGINYQDSAGTIRAINTGDVVGLLTDHGTVTSGVSQPITDNKPTLRKNVWNTRPVWRFDGTNDWMQGPFGALLSQPYTYIAVASLNAANVNNGVAYYITDGDDNTRRALLWKNHVPAPDAWSIEAGTILNGGSADANYNIWTALFNGGSSVLWINGVVNASGNAGANGIDGITIGGGYSGLKNWPGDVAEVIIYGVNLSSFDKNQINRYLAAKYGITYTAIP